jgi:hypothetical protein
MGESRREPLTDVKFCRLILLIEVKLCAITILIISLLDGSVNLQPAWRNMQATQMVGLRLASGHKGSD